MGLGAGALLAKIDIKSAYRLVPVHPDDRMFLGMLWEGGLYVNGMLPFGLRSAPKNLYGGLGCAGVVHCQDGGGAYLPLPRRFYSTGSTRLRELRSVLTGPPPRMRPTWGPPCSRKAVWAHPSRHVSGH